MQRKIRMALERVREVNYPKQLRQIQGRSIELVDVLKTWLISRELRAPRRISRLQCAMARSRSTLMMSKSRKRERLGSSLMKTRSTSTTSRPRSRRIDAIRIRTSSPIFSKCAEMPEISTRRSTSWTSSQKR